MLGKYLLLPLFMAALFTGGCADTSLETGILHGKVSIGPTSPVERPGEPAMVPCQVYEARKILVYNEKGDELIQQIDIDCDGRYKTDLKPGTYLVDINHIGIDSSSDIPRKVEIKSSLTARLDVNIDTGIR